MTPIDLKARNIMLADGEQRHRDAPATFGIPPLEVRQGLKLGDCIKLIFLPCDEAEKPVQGGERMWVEVVERTAHGYLGTLDNEPTFIKLERGDVISFEPRHVVSIST